MVLLGGLRGCRLGCRIGYVDPSGQRDVLFQADGANFCNII